MRKVQLVAICSECGSREVVGTATTIWSVDDGAWVMHSNDDEYWCGSCEDKCGIDYPHILGHRY